MDTNRVCPSCRKPLSPDVPLGLCPECLIKSGFQTGPDEATDGRGSATPPPAIADLQPLFPQLQILALVGRGGMGAVYKARQPALDRLVALKILPADVGPPGFAERFNREARALARLSHPRIVAVHDFGVAGAFHYLVMEFVDGPNLRQLQQHGRLAPEAALQIVPQICEALQFAHDQGVVHRDIKPENLLLDRDGRIKITDFGIAKMVGVNVDTTWLTGGRDIVGTPHYMAPEQIETPTDVDHRADIYSLGVVFYEMLTGELPLGRFAAPSKRVQVDVRLDEVVLRTLEKEPARRYQQADQVRTRVEAIAASAPRMAAPSAPITFMPALVLYALQAALVIPAEWAFFTGYWGAAFGWTMASLFVLVLAYLAWGLLHYACWTSLPERYRATTPGQAVGFVFIPVFNFYWAFVTFPRLANGFNALRADRPELPLRNMKALGVAKAIAFVCYWSLAWIPGLASMGVLIDLVVFVLYYRGIVFNANLLIAHPE